jgi:hypothetical protein
MIKRLTVEPTAQPNAQEADNGIVEQPRLVLSWRPDPASGKPVASWVLETPAMTNGESLRRAA